MDRVVRYYKVNNNPKATHLKAEIYYSLGGMNYFTSRDEPRGYYMSISPVKRDGVCESYTAFTGLKNLILPVHRKSQKQMDIAKKYFDDHIIEFMRRYFSEFDVETDNYEIA